MDFYFVYSSGGGAGDWNAIDRVFRDYMPEYFKDHILLKFGDIFFNHRSLKSLIKPRNWQSVDNAKSWLINNTQDESIMSKQNMIMDVGTTKIVSYLTSSDANISALQLIARFKRIMDDEEILKKYCDIITKSDIKNAVTFDIPNLFKVRNQQGTIESNLFDEPNCKRLLIDACAEYANYIYQNTGNDPDKLLTILNITWQEADIDYYFSKLNYTPTKLGIGGAAFYPDNKLKEELTRLNSLIDFTSFSRVHFLGCGGLKRSKAIKDTIGNLNNFSVDNTTPYNRGIDGNTRGTTHSGYFDYATGDLIRITHGTINEILFRHNQSINSAVFSKDEMNEILLGVLDHQSGKSSPYTYECRAKLIIHNFDVFKYRASI